MLEITSIILKQLKKPESLIKHVDDRLGHVARHAVDTSKIQSKLGWKPRYDFAENIESTIRWYIDNEEWWRKVKEKSEEYKAWAERQYKDFK